MLLARQQQSLTRLDVTRRAMRSRTAHGEQPMFVVGESRNGKVKRMS
jgi:hypothetical protein